MDDLLDELTHLGKSCTTPQYDAVLTKIAKHSKCTLQLLEDIKSCVNREDNWLFAAADFGALEEKIGTILSQDPNRIKVYAGHHVYEITVNGICHRIRDDDTIVHDGKTYTGEQFYDTYRTL